MMVMRSSQSEKTKLAYDLESLDHEVRLKAKTIFANPKLINSYLKKRTKKLEKKILLKFRELNLDDNNLLIAVGGFGRQEIFPNSDHDLSIIRINKSKKDSANIKEFISWMWDEGLKPGISVRDRKSTRLNSSHVRTSRMPSSA